MTAVSRSGFSKPARAKAAHVGIDIRTIEELSDEDLSTWMPKVSVQGVAGKLVRGRVELSVYPQDGGDLQSIQDALPLVGWADPLFESAEVT